MVRLTVGRVNVPEEFDLVKNGYVIEEGKGSPASNSTIRIYDRWERQRETFDAIAEEVHIWAFGHPPEPSPE